MRSERPGWLSIGFDAETVGSSRNLRALDIDGRCKFLGISRPDELIIRFQLLHDGGVARNRLNICGDPAVKVLRHIAQPEQADEPVERQVRVAGFDGGLNVGCRGSALLVGHHNQLYSPGFDLRPDDRQRGLAEIADGLNTVSIRDLVDIQIGALQDSGES